MYQRICNNGVSIMCVTSSKTRLTSSGRFSSSLSFSSSLRSSSSLSYSTSLDPICRMIFTLHFSNPSLQNSHSTCRMCGIPTSRIIRLIDVCSDPQNFETSSITGQGCYTQHHKQSNLQPMHKRVPSGSVFKRKNGFGNPVDVGPD